jgi:hypothetical protein
MEEILKGLLGQLWTLLPLLPPIAVPYILEWTPVGGRAVKRLLPKSLRKPLAIMLGATLAGFASGLTGMDLSGPFLPDGLSAGGMAGLGALISAGSSSGFTVGQKTT